MSVSDWGGFWISLKSRTDLSNTVVQSPSPIMMYCEQVNSIHTVHHYNSATVSWEYKFPSYIYTTNIYKSTILEGEPDIIQGIIRPERHGSILRSNCTGTKIPGEPEIYTKCVLSEILVLG